MTLELRSDRQIFLDWLEYDLTLTPVELRIVKTLGYRFGEWCSRENLVKIVWHASTNPDVIHADFGSLRTHLWRLRRKLERSPWRIENRYHHGLYRLVRTDKLHA